MNQKGHNASISRSKQCSRYALVWLLSTLKQRPDSQIPYS